MKKKIFASYVYGIRDKDHGDSYSTILGYFLPEFITGMVLYSILYLADARWVADLKSTSTYATLGITNTMLHFIVKLAEGLSVGTIIVSGFYNGKEQFKDVGRTIANAFWVTCITGGFIAFLLYSGAYWIYYLYGVPPKMIQLGVPFLRLRAISVFFMFVYFAIVGFLRGIKKPRIPMQIFLLGGITFLFFDYALIFGKFGFPEMKLQGSAAASVIQYGVMLVAGIAYILFDEDNRKYGITLFDGMLSWNRINEILQLSWPVMLDKATFAAAYLWLGAMINPMGKYAIASFTVIKDLERLAIQPAAAFAQVITFVVSNSYGMHDWDGIKSNIKKIVFMASMFVFSILFVFSLWPDYFIHIFDQKDKFTVFSAKVFPILSVLVFFDLLQLILSGALRGAANVKIVMWSRLAICIFYFMPVSYYFSTLPMENMTLKFLLVYGSFYCGSGLMSIIYIYRFRGERWKQKTI